MKRVLLLISIALSLSSFSQEKSDYLVYDASKIVKPRIVKMDTIQIDDTAFKFPSRSLLNSARFDSEPAEITVIELERRIASLEARLEFYQPTRYFNRTGEIMNPTSNRRVWRDTLTPTTSSGYVIPIDAAGFTEVQQVYMTVQKNTSSGDTPIPSIKDLTMTALTVNMSSSNTAVVTILGNNVLSGTPLVVPSGSPGVRLFVTVIGK